MAIGEVVELLGQEIIQICCGVRPGDFDHAAVGTVDYGRKFALLHQRRAIMPGHAVGIDEGGLAEGCGAGAGEEVGWNGSHEADVSA